MGKKVIKRYVIDEEQLESICSTAAKAGIEAYRLEVVREQKERHARVLNSAKALITNYRRFKALCQKSVYDLETTNNEYQLKDIIMLMSGKMREQDYEILSIKEKVVRTKIIMDHVDTMLAVYKKQCELSSDPEEARRYRIINAVYLSETPQRIGDVAEAENITVSTAYRDCDKAYRRLAVLFFGIDGVDFKKNQKSVRK